MERDYFTDERLWAINRRSWRFRVLWRRWRLPLVAALIIVAWAYLSWCDLQDEKARRIRAEADVVLLLTKITQYNCTGPGYYPTPTKPKGRRM